MIFHSTIISVIENVILMLPALLVVAFTTVAERKTMGSMQRRLGPNAVGYYGLLQAFADALKLILKEYVAPTQANLILFFLGPIVTLIFSLLGYAVIPYGPGLSLSDMELGILFMLAVSSLATYGILLAGWSANSKYAFLGSLRSTAQLISYELVLSSVLLIVILITNSLNLNLNVQFQKTVWLALPLLCILIIFFIGSVAETNRAPFDLAEAESELVSGFMTEHAAVIFVFFFLAEYASIVLMCIFTSILFLGGYLIDFDYSYLLYNYYYFDYSIPSNYSLMRELSLDIPSFNGLLTSLTLGIKSSAIVFLFIWVRASFPRIRFDQLMSFCWTILLPILFGFIVLVPCLLSTFGIFLPNLFMF
jgi:NADH-ubiquinone oxidoreductase chain 1